MRCMVYHRCVGMWYTDCNLICVVCMYGVHSGLVVGYCVLCIGYCGCRMSVMVCNTLFIVWCVLYAAMLCAIVCCVCYSHIDGM